MRLLLVNILLFSYFLSIAQEFKIEFVKQFDLNADKFIGVDEFENIYYIKDNTLFKETAYQTYNYTNTQLGNISSIDIKSPLKILAFYNDFNTVLLLDNRLNELSSPINFTAESILKNIHLTTLSSNNNLWLYSLDDNILTLWNHQTKKTKFSTQPLSTYEDNFKVEQIISSYKNCWLIGNNSILKFNEFGTFLEKFTIDNGEAFQIYDNNLVYKKNNKLFIHRKDKESIQLDLGQDISTESFYIRNEQIYFFDGTKVFVFRFLKN